MKTTVIGLGLIGGSIAIDLRRAGLATELVGIDLNPANAARAIELGLVDKIDNEGLAISTADLVVLAIPVNALSQLLFRVSTSKAVQQFTGHLFPATVNLVEFHKPGVATL